MCSGRSSRRRCNFQAAGESRRLAGNDRLGLRALSGQYPYSDKRNRIVRRVLEALCSCTAAFSLSRGISRSLRRPLGRMSGGNPIGRIGWLGSLEDQTDGPVLVADWCRLSLLVDIGCLSIIGREADRQRHQIDEGYPGNICNG